MTTLSADRVSRIYDRIGRWQDSQAFYEDRAVRELLDHGELAAARGVVELGCGTGRLAERLLERHLPPDATYLGVDVSSRMVELARDRLARFGARAQVRLSPGGVALDLPDAACDRFVSTFVLDLLSEQEIRQALAEAHRLLRPHGRLCLAGLSTGVGPVSRAVARLWAATQRRAPGLVGGCRPLELEAFLPDARWRILHHARLSSFGVPLEALVAEPI